MGRLQHRLDDHPRAAQKVLRAAGFFQAQLRIQAHFVIGQRPPKRLQAKLPHELVGTGGVGRRCRLARNQTALIAAAKRRRRQSLGRFAVGFGLQRRDPLPFHLVLEAVDEVFFGEAAGRLNLIAQAGRAPCGRTGCASAGAPSVPSARAARPARSSPAPGAPARPTGRPDS